MEYTCFLLTTSFRDTSRGFEMVFHAVTDAGEPLTITIDTFRPLFFVPRTCPIELTREAHERKALALCSMHGLPVDCLYFQSFRASRTMAEKLHQAAIPTFESDVNPVERFLMERFVKGGFSVEGAIRRGNQGIVVRNPRMRGCNCSPVLKVLSIDIETSVAEGTIYSVAGHGTGDDFVLVIGEQPPTGPVRFCPDERTLLNEFMKQLAQRDPDLLIGWSVIDFDLRMLESRCSLYGIPFAIGRGGNGRLVPAAGGMGKHLAARVPGRVVMDVPVMLRTYYRTFEEYSLNYVAGEMLGRSKLIEKKGEDKIAEIDWQFREDKHALARYNLEDAVLTKGIFDKAGILPNAIERSRRSGLPLDRARGNVAAFDFLYLPLLHRAGTVAGNVADVAASAASLTGGYVMEPDPGMYENVLVLDFKSLYPTIIMSFCIDPLGLVHASQDRISGPSGRSFAREPSILPLIIDELMEARAEAKRTHNPYLSQAIKILMNSFYGVLGTTGCRFFSSDLAQAITETGQYIFRIACAHIEQTTGCRVIYGDTDSLFLHLGPDAQDRALSIGEETAREVTDWLARHLATEFGARSRLELEFETHFRHFLIPSVRGGGAGSKKHYCGATETDGHLELHFKGMESARSDWTDLAKEFQYELCMRLFQDRSVEEYVLSVVAELRTGSCDNKLVYRKRLRKELNEYVGAIPPHVQAARLMDKPSGTIRYCVTMDGPQPAGDLRAPIDYEHYILCQLKPIADTLLAWTDCDFDRLVSGQQYLFSGM